MNPKTLTLPAAILAILLIACGSGSRDNNSGGNTDNQPPPVTKTTAPVPVETTERPGAGSLRTTLRDTTGTERVSCPAISTEFRIIADFGWIEWTAIAVSQEPTFQAPDQQAGSVTVTPSSGKLEKDQSVLVKVRGSYSGTNKTFWIRAQENSGTAASMNAVKFAC
jgi:hypothetical protein